MSLPGQALLWSLAPLMAMEATTLSSAGWPELIVKSLPQFADAVAHYTESGFGPFRRFAYRGQSESSWSLRPTLARELKAYTDIKGKAPRWLPESIEKMLLVEFKKRIHLYGESNQSIDLDNDLNTLVLGRHYGLPTRLLDWSFSPYVAVWNACAEQVSKPGAVWCVSVTVVNSRTPDGQSPLIRGEGEHLDKILYIRSTEPALEFFSPKAHNKRSSVQQSIFSIAADGLLDHDGILHDTLTSPPLDDRETHLKIVIPPESKRHFIQRLRAMNVTAEALSPGLEGLCRELVQVLRDFPYEHDEDVARSMKLMTGQ